MAKNGVFKKITALAMAIALVVCFAVSASAVTVSTTTKYVGEVDSVKYIDVTVNVTDAGANNNVTYYAQNDTTGVHIDQEKADGNGAAEFNYRTEYDNLGSTTAKIGVTGASSAVEEGGAVDGYKVTLKNGNAADQVKYLADVDQTAVTFNYTANTNMKLKEVTVDNADNATVNSAVDNSNGTLTVTFSSITGDVVLTVVEEETEADTKVAEVLEIGAVVSTGKVDGVIGNVTDAEGNVIENPDIQASEGDVKLTVIGMATGGEEYGILVSKDAITGYNEEIAYKGIAILAEDDTKLGYAAGLFAVQIIDTSKTGAMIEAGETYNIAVYVGNETNGYKISAVQQKTIPTAAAEQN